MTLKKRALILSFLLVWCFLASAATFDYSRIESVSVLYAAQMQVEPENIPSDFWLNEFDLQNLTVTLALIEVQFIPISNSVYRTGAKYFSFDEYFAKIENTQWPPETSPLNAFSKDEFREHYENLVKSEETRIENTVNSIKRGFSDRLLYVKISDGKLEQKFVSNSTGIEFYESEQSLKGISEKESGFKALKRIYAQFRPTQFEDSSEKEGFFDQKTVLVSAPFSKEGLLENENTRIFLASPTYSQTPPDFFDYSFKPGTHSFPTLKIKKLVETGLASLPEQIQNQNDSTIEFQNETTNRISEFQSKIRKSFYEQKLSLRVISEHNKKFNALGKIIQYDLLSDGTTYIQSEPKIVADTQNPTNLPSYSVTAVPVASPPMEPI